MAVVLQGVRYRYAGGLGFALNGLDLTIEPGRVTGVVGANESGKSTLCLVAAGLAPGVIAGSLEGSAALDGADVRSLRPHELAQRAGLLFQNPSTQLSGTTATVFEEVAFGPCNLGLETEEILVRVRESLALLGIEALAPRSPNRLSGGQAQLVALAAVLALRPAYLVLDEPTSQLDPAGTMLVADALAALAARTRTGLLVVEHKTEVLERIADEVVVLEAGRVVMAGPCREVLADPRLEALGVEAPPRVRVARACVAAGLAVSPEMAAALEAPR